MSTLESLTSSTGFDHYTSARIVEPARRTLGHIDLDPASSTEANRVVKATRIFTRADDGKLQRWDGKAFVNPPSSKIVLPRTASAVEKAKAKAENIKTGDVRTWWVKAIGELCSGHVDAFVFVVFRIDALTSMAAGSLEHRLPLPLSGRSCWPHSRMTYWRPGAQLQLDGTPAEEEEESPTHATAILCHSRFPIVLERFEREFAHLGTICGEVSRMGVAS